MMVVFFAGNLVESSQLRRVDFPQPSILNKKLQITVDSCLVEGFYNPAAGIKNFGNSQWPICIEKDFLDGISLVCFPIHFGS